MSDNPERPGWWQASNGVWYPPPRPAPAAHPTNGCAIAAIVGASIFALVLVPFGLAIVVITFLGRSNIEPLSNRGAFPPPPSLPSQRAESALPDALFLGNEPGSEPMISRADAEAVALAMRQVQLDATDARQLTDLRELTTRFERWDSVVSAFTAAPFSRLQAVSVDDVLVSPGGAYPATFLVVLRGTDNGAVVSRFQVFERQDKASPWRIALSTGYNGWPVRLNAPSTPGTVGEAHGLHHQLADYYRAWKEDARAPLDTRFAAGPHTSDIGSDLSALPQDGDYGRGIRLHVAFHAADEVWAFEAPEGHLECGAVWQVLDYDGARQVGDRSNWGNELAPGNYRWIRQVDLFMSCIQESADGKLIVFGQSGGRAIVRASRDRSIDPAIVDVSGIVPGLEDPPYWP